MKHSDYMLGFMLTAATWVADHFNAFVGGCVGVASLILMVLKIRHAWRHRND